MPDLSSDTGAGRVDLDDPDITCTEGRQIVFVDPDRVLAIIDWCLANKPHWRSTLTGAPRAAVSAASAARARSANALAWMTATPPAPAPGTSCTMRCNSARIP